MSDVSSGSTPPKIPIENRPTTAPTASPVDKAPDNAPQNVSVNNPGTVSTASELPQPEDSEDKSLTDVARKAGNGEFGRGQEMRKNLKDAGWDFREVQAEIVRLRNQ